MMAHISWDVPYFWYYSEIKYEWDYISKERGSYSSCWDWSQLGMYTSSCLYICKLLTLKKTDFDLCQIYSKHILVSRVFKAFLHLHWYISMTVPYFFNTKLSAVAVKWNRIQEYIPASYELWYKESLTMRLLNCSLRFCTQKYSAS